MKTKVFIDGHSGTTGLRIYERLAERQDIEVLQISEALRKEPSEVKKYMAAADIAFLCLPDQAAIEAVSLAAETKVRIIDTSTAHRTAPDWVYGFPELSQTQAQRIAKSASPEGLCAFRACFFSGKDVIIGRPLRYFSAS